MNIGLTMREVIAGGTGEVRDAIARDWMDFFNKNFPEVNLILLPNHLEQALKLVNNLKIDGLILSGGNSLGEAPQRDLAESALVEHFLLKDMPIFGVCRGMQLINKIMGGDLQKNIFEVSGEKHSGTTHKIKIVDDIYKKIAGEEDIAVNSYHDQGVMLPGLSKKLKVFAVSNAGVVEGCYYPGKPLVAIQWHVERRQSVLAGEFDKRMISHLFNFNY